MNKKVYKIIGIFIIIIGIILLIFNEKSFLKEKGYLKEARLIYQDIPNNKIDINNQNKLVSTNGNLTTDKTITDDIFNVSVKGLKLNRNVKMYQWQETCKEKCTYKKVWSSKLIDSSKFKNKNYMNPTAMPYKNISMINENIKLGSFDINPDLLLNLKTNKEVTNLPDLKGFKKENNYYTNASSSPKIGDVRVSFSYLDSKYVSILAGQDGSGFSKYKIDNNYIYSLFTGKLNGKEIINKLDQNKSLRYIKLLINLIIIILGFITFLDSKIRFKFKKVVYLNRYILSIILSLLIEIFIISIMNIKYNLILSIILMIIILIIMLILIIARKNKDDENVETLTL